MSDNNDITRQISDILSQLANILPYIEYSVDNLPIGNAVCRMVELSSTDLVLFLGKDWQLAESRCHAFTSSRW